MNIPEILKTNLISDVENTCEINLNKETVESLKRAFEITIGTFALTENTKIAKKLSNALMAYIKAFEKKHEITYNGSKGDDLMDVLSFNDYFVHITDIITDIDKDVDKEVFFQWYEDTLDFAMEHGLDRTINYNSYIMGLRFHMLIKKQKT